ncbi:MAG: pyridoxamine 5'-phosphate oxidase family protein [Burkholderiales bacterium]|nr:pyridoxamine 5'-phosphate oxidase family protein [Burkholderiales bacterium]
MDAANLPSRARGLAYLTGHHVATLATQGTDGPWAAAVFYVSLDFDLVFLSMPKSRHARNIASNGQVAAAIQEDYGLWQQVKGIQLEGVVNALAGDAAIDARRIYEAKFPIARADDATPAAIAAALDKVSWFRLVARRAFFIDNSAGFGHREQIL